MGAKQVGNDTFIPQDQIYLSPDEIPRVKKISYFIFAKNLIVGLLTITNGNVKGSFKTAPGGGGLCEGWKLPSNPNSFFLHL